MLNFVYCICWKADTKVILSLVEPHTSITYTVTLGETNQLQTKLPKTVLYINAMNKTSTILAVYKKSCSHVI